MNALKRNIAKWATYDITSHASVLKWTTLIIWACSLVAEVGTFAANKKLPKKEKSFIIKQELTAGGISLAIMYLLADQFERAGAKLVTQAKLLPKELPVQWRNPETIEKILKADSNFLKNELKGDKAWIEKLLSLKKGTSVVAGTLGTIIAFNITTPLISNKIASYFQNKSLLQNKSPAPKKPPTPPSIAPNVFPQVSNGMNASIRQPGMPTPFSTPVQTPYYYRQTAIFNR